MITLETEQVGENLIRNKRDKTLAFLLALIAFAFRAQVQGLQNQKKQAVIDCDHIS